MPPTYQIGKLDRKKRNSISLWQKHGPFATRNFSAAMYVNAYGTLPDDWDWVASKHLLTLPYPLNQEDRTESPERTLSGKTAKKATKPPPPVHKGGASVSPSPAKSHGSFKGSPSRGGSSWEGDWKSSGSQFRDWQKHRRYHS